MELDIHLVAHEVGNKYLAENGPMSQIDTEFLITHSAPFAHMYALPLSSVAFSHSLSIAFIPVPITLDRMIVTWSTVGVFDFF